jgi:hypothetical protein
MLAPFMFNLPFNTEASRIGSTQSTTHFHHTTWCHTTEDGDNLTAFLLIMTVTQKED